MNISSRSLCLSLILFIGAIPLHASYDDIKVIRIESSQVSDTALLAGTFLGSVLIGLAGYRVYKWWSGPSDEQLLTDAYHALHKKEFCQPLLSYTNMWYLKGYSASQVNNEQWLYDLSYAKIQQEYIGAYIETLKSDIKQIEYLHKTIKRRIAKMECCSLKEAHLLNELRFVEQQLQAAKIEIHFLISVLTCHRSYIELFEYESDMWARYKEELAVLSKYEADCFTCKNILIEIAYNKTLQSRYPLIAYVVQLEKDMIGLTKKIDAATYYAGRAHEGKKLHAQLQYVYQVLIASKSYRDEYVTYEQEKRYEEQVALQQQQIYELQQLNFRNNIKDINKLVRKGYV